jgi:hypothetical protein
VHLVLLRVLAVASTTLGCLALLSYDLLLKNGVVPNFLNFGPGLLLGGAYVLDRIYAHTVCVLLLIQALKRLLTSGTILGHVSLAAGSNLLGNLRARVTSNLFVNHSDGWRHRLDLRASLLMAIFVINIVV